MLARTIALICLGFVLCRDLPAQALKPNVVVILTEDSGSFTKTAESGTLKKFTELHHASFKAAPGRAALTAAIIYGKEPLLTGVVHESDWRRIPVAGPAIMAAFRKAGYGSLFYGHWRLGGSAPFDPASRGFDDAMLTQVGRLTDTWGSSAVHPSPRKWQVQHFSDEATKEKPLFCWIDDPGGASYQKTIQGVGAFAAAQFEKLARPTLCIIISVSEPRAHKQSELHFFNTLKWSVYGHGIKLEHTPLPWLRSVLVDKDLHRGLLKLIGADVAPDQTYHFFHQANWPSDQSPAKYRHRGSLVMDEDYALVDGLKLYPVSRSRQPDFTQLLDISEYQEIHRKMLTDHAKWWMVARKALYDPRAFFVGVEDKQPTQLTAMDWRPSQITHADGSVPVSQPIIYQKDLLAFLEGLRDEQYRQSFPAYCGSWAVHVTRPGRYKITASLLPKNAIGDTEKDLKKLKGGRAFIRLGKNEVQLNLLKGASAVSVLVDSDAGVTDLECWFTGQLALERELGAFYVEIERVGDKKFDFKAKVP